MWQLCFCDWYMKIREIPLLEKSCSLDLCLKVSVLSKARLIDVFENKGKSSSSIDAFSRFGMLDSYCVVGGSCFIYGICIYLYILLSNTISISDDIILNQQMWQLCFCDWYMKIREIPLLEKSCPLDRTQ
jgi:hypothetical protein